MLFNLKTLQCILPYPVLSPWECPFKLCFCFFLKNRLILLGNFNLDLLSHCPIFLMVVESLNYCLDLSCISSGLPSAFCETHFISPSAFSLLSLSSTQRLQDFLYSFSSPLRGSSSWMLCSVSPTNSYFKSVLCLPQNLLILPPLKVIYACESFCSFPPFSYTPGKKNQLRLRAQGAWTG